MPPNAPYGQQYGGQPGYPAQPQPYAQQPPAPYGPPQAAASPYYGAGTGPAAQPMAARPAPRDPYAWQRLAKAAVDRSVQQFGTYSQPSAPTQPPVSPYPAPAYQQPMQQPAAYGYNSQPVPMQQPYPQPRQPDLQQPVFVGGGSSAQPYGAPMAPQQFGPQAAAGQFPQQQTLPQPQYVYGERRGKRWPFSLFGNKRFTSASLVVVGVIGAMGGVTFLANMGGSGNDAASILSEDGEKVTPEQLFRNSLVKSLQTKSYTQKVVADGLQVERKVDVAAASSTRLSGSATVSDQNTVVEVYATANDTFAKLIKSDLLTTRPTLQGTWLQARKAGKVLDTPAASPSVFELLFTPPTALYDPFVIGNYSSAESQALQKIIDEQLVYRFDPSSVIQSVIDGQDASEFSVTVSASGRQALASKAAELAGVSQERITEARLLSQLAGNANVKLLVAVSNKAQQIIQVKEESDKPRTTTYSAYDNTVPSAAPSAAAPWDAAFR